MSAIPYRQQGFAASAVRAWVRFYTLGLPEEHRERRSFQIESDLWEHWRDRAESQSPPLLLSWETTDRALRGMAADILWRFQLEGPKVRIHVPIERLAGAFVLLLILATFLSLSANGYDTGREGFADELERLASIKGWQTDVYTLLQVGAGLGMILSAAVFFLQLRERAPATAVVAAFLMASAGILTMVSASVYLSAADLADQWAADGRTESSLTAARALTLMLFPLSMAIFVTLAGAMYTLAVAATRLELVKHPLPWLAAGSATLSLATLGALVTQFETAEWLLVSAAMVSMLVWMASTGLQLLIGGRVKPSKAGALPDAISPAS
ncbi:MAG: hypothetical protein KC495_06095 [Dehalococcoidia bacterium]|nr:hypothetical protein [Dehalococcoidia bacterium]